MSLKRRQLRVTQNSEVRSKNDYADILVSKFINVQECGQTGGVVMTFLKPNNPILYNNCKWNNSITWECKQPKILANVTLFITIKNNENNDRQKGRKVKGKKKEGKKRKEKERKSNKRKEKKRQMSEKGMTK